MKLHPQSQPHQIMKLIDCDTLGSYDYVATNFFIDTAPNIIDYVETIVRGAPPHYPQHHPSAPTPHYLTNRRGDHRTWMGGE